jgi:hypothetical protein
MLWFEFKECSIVQCRHGIVQTHDAWLHDLRGDAAVTAQRIEAAGAERSLHAMTRVARRNPQKDGGANAKPAPHESQQIDARDAQIAA